MSKLTANQIALTASIAIMNGRDPSVAAGELVANHKDPTNLLTKALAQLEENGVPNGKLFSLTELRDKFKAAKSKGTGKGAKALGVGDTKKFKVQVVKGRAFLRIPVDAFDAGQVAIQLSTEDLSAEERRSRVPTMNVSLRDDGEGQFIIVEG